MADVAGIAHVVLRVEDWKRSATWYQDVLGFERHKGDGFTALRHPGADFVILLRPTGEEQVPSSSPTQRIDHVALRVPSADDLEDWCERLHAQGIEVEIESQPIGSSITLHDPDGLEVELFAAAPGSVLDVGTVDGHLHEHIHEQR